MSVNLTRRAMLLGTAVGLAACSGRSVLVDAPTLNTGAGSFPAQDVPLAERMPQARIFFATDRALDAEGAFGVDRSQELRYGEALMNIGDPGTSWADVVAQSNGENRDLSLELADTQVTGVLPATPIPFTLRNGRPVDIPELIEAYELAEGHLQAAISAQLNRFGSGDVLLHIPGVNTTFAQGAAALTDLWHHSGRTMVPIVYSWPSGQPGLLGYFVDRESGQFTIFHLKEFLKQLASTPGVRRIHIVAHSRGTDIVTTALREMIIAERARGEDPRETLRIENLVLAAADLSFDIVAQRIVAERLGPAFGRITAYASQGDKALAIAQRLMSGTRFGRLEPDAIPPNVREIFQHMDNVNFIQIDQAGEGFGHSYFRENPKVLSDIVLLLKTCAAPGTPTRPLEPISGNFWLMQKDYLDRGSPISGSCGGA